MRRALATGGWGDTPRQLAVGGWSFLSSFEIVWVYNGASGAGMMYGDQVITDLILL